MSNRADVGNTAVRFPISGPGEGRVARPAWQVDAAWLAYAAAAALRGKELADNPFAAMAMVMGPRPEPPGRPKPGSSRNASRNEGPPAAAETGVEPASTEPQSLAATWAGLGPDVIRPGRMASGRNVIRLRPMGERGERAARAPATGAKPGPLPLLGAGRGPESCESRGPCPSSSQGPDQRCLRLLRR